MKHQSEIKRRQNSVEEEKEAINAAKEEKVTNEKVRKSFDVLLTEREHLIETIEKL